MKSKILFKFEQLETGTLQGFWGTDNGQNPVTSENQVDCLFKRVGMGRRNYLNYFYTKKWRMIPAIPLSCSLQSASLALPLHPQRGLWCFPCFSILFQESIKWKMCFKNNSIFLTSHWKGNRKLHSVLTVNIYNTQKSNSRSKIGNYCPCYSKYIRRKQTVWLILCKTVNHKSHSRDFKSTAFSWKKQPGFFLKFLETRL